MCKTKYHDNLSGGCSGVFSTQNEEIVLPLDIIITWEPYHWLFDTNKLFIQ